MWCVLWLFLLILLLSCSQQDDGDVQSRKRVKKPLRCVRVTNIIFNIMYIGVILLLIFLSLAWGSSCALPSAPTSVVDQQCVSGARMRVALPGDSKPRCVGPGRLWFPPLQHCQRVWSQSGRSTPAPQAPH